jgi:hypothetical protein
VLFFQKMEKKSKISDNDVSTNSAWKRIAASANLIRMLGTFLDFPSRAFFRTNKNIWRLGRTPAAFPPHIKLDIDKFELPSRANLKPELKWIGPATRSITFSSRRNELINHKKLPNDDFDNVGGYLATFYDIERLTIDLTHPWYWEKWWHVCTTFHPEHLVINANGINEIKSLPARTIKLTISRKFPAMIWCSDQIEHLTLRDSDPTVSGNCDRWDLMAGESFKARIVNIWCGQSMCSRHWKNLQVLTLASIGMYGMGEATISDHIHDRDGGLTTMHYLDWPWWNAFWGKRNTNLPRLGLIQLQGSTFISSTSLIMLLESEKLVLEISPTCIIATRPSWRTASLDVTNFPSNAAAWIQKHVISKYVQVLPSGDFRITCGADVVSRFLSKEEYMDR